jgi:hypothetical protein
METWCRWENARKGSFCAVLIQSDADSARDTSKGHKDVQNSAEQGDTANIKQNTTNAGFFKGRRVK